KVIPSIAWDRGSYVASTAPSAHGAAALARPLLFPFPGKRSTTSLRNRRPFPQGQTARRDVLPGSATQGPAPVGLGFNTPEPPPVPCPIRVRTLRLHLSPNPAPRSPPSPGGLLFFHLPWRFRWRPHLGKSPSPKRKRGRRPASLAYASGSEMRTPPKLPRRNM